MSSQSRGLFGPPNDAQKELVLLGRGALQEEVCELWVGEGKQWGNL